MVAVVVLATSTDVDHVVIISGGAGAATLSAAFTPTTAADRVTFEDARALALRAWRTTGCCRPSPWHGVLRAVAAGHHSHLAVAIAALLRCARHQALSSGKPWYFE